MDQTSKTATANTHRTAAVQTIRRPLVAMIMPAAVVNMSYMAVAQTRLRRPADPNSKDAPATHTNSAAAQTVSPFKRVRIVRDVTARTPNTSAARMALRPHRAKTLKAAHVRPADSAVARMVSPMRRAPTLRVALLCQWCHKRLVALTKMPEIVAIMRLNTSLTWNMVAAHDSGTAAAAEMAIALNRSKSVKAPANRPLDAIHARCQRSMDHARLPSIDTIMTRIAINVRLSLMVAAWAIPTTLKH